MSGTRRERPKPLLRSALIALGAGGGLMVAGCVLWDAGPASAQTMLTANPHAMGVVVAHHRPHDPAPGHAHKAGASGRHGSAKSGHTGSHAARSSGAGLHASTLTSPSARTAANPAATAVPAPATGPTAATDPTAIPGPAALASGGQSDQSPTKAGSHGRPVHAAGLNSPTSAKSKGGARKTSRLTPARTTPAPKSNRARPASPRSSGRNPASTVVVPANGATRPERLPLLPFGPFAFVPAAAGPGPASAPAAILGSPLPLVGLQPFHLPFGIPRGWAGETVSESARLKVPLALLAAMAVFVLVQSLIDRRDPKLSRAPEHSGEDSVGFE